jgi:hypothetical protein
MARVRIATRARACITRRSPPLYKQEAAPPIFWLSGCAYALNLHLVPDRPHAFHVARDLDGAIGLVPILRDAAQMHYTIIGVDVNVGRTDELIHRELGFDLRRDPTVAGLLGHRLIPLRSGAVSRAGTEPCYEDACNEKVQRGFPGHGLPPELNVIAEGLAASRVPKMPVL